MKKLMMTTLVATLLATGAFGVSAGKVDLDYGKIHCGVAAGPCIFA